MSSPDQPQEQATVTLGDLIQSLDQISRWIEDIREILDRIDPIMVVDDTGLRWMELNPTESLVLSQSRIRDAETRLEALRRLGEIEFVVLNDIDSVITLGQCPPPRADPPPRDDRPADEDT